MSTMEPLNKMTAAMLGISLLINAMAFDARDARSRATAAENAAAAALGMVPVIEQRPQPPPEIHHFRV